MAWIIEPLQIAENNRPTGKWRLTATSDEDGGGPYGDPKHHHNSSDECLDCDVCDEYVSRVSGFPSKRKLLELEEERDRREYERLAKKYSPVAQDIQS